MQTAQPMPFESDAEIAARREQEAATAKAQYAGRIVSADEIFPDDKWQDVPELDEGTKGQIAREHVPFYLLQVSTWTSDRFRQGGQFWSCVIVLPGNTVMRLALSQIEERYDPVLKAREPLRLGALATGPFTLAEVDTGKGNPYIKLVPWRDTTQPVGPPMLPELPA